MKSCNHYESAFVQFLQSLAIPYLPTQETKRSFAGEEEYGSLKNIDFLVMNRAACETPLRLQQSKKLETSSWLIDIKGRRFPSGTAHPQYWRNWVCEDDLVSLSRWETIFGDGFQGLIVFAYDVIGERSPIDRSRLFEFQNRQYAFLGIPLSIYYRECKPLSPRWRTVTMPNAKFREAAIPLDELL